MLIVTGDEASVIKQIWHCNDDNPEIFTRNYEGEEWSSWKSACYLVDQVSPGYFKLPNGIIIQWGSNVGAVVIYQVAFPSLAAAVFAKRG